eukprot:841581-Prorocentrum_minimum.AAC.2
MRKCITVALVFFAGFLVSFNVVRNIYTLTQYRVHTHNEDSLAHHSFGSEVSEVRSAHKQQQQVEEIVDDIDDEAVDAIQDEEVAPEEEKEADPPPPPPSPPSPTAAKPSQQQANTDCTGEACGCHTEKNAEYWGDVVMWGQNHFEPSAEACCAACRNFKPKGQDDDPCNTWVWCPDPKGCSGQKHQSCWLKFHPHPEAPAVSRGPEVGWTSGALYKVRHGALLCTDELSTDGTSVLYIHSPCASQEDPTKQKLEPGKSRKFHVVVTSNDSRYVQWQCRVMYYWYKKRKVPTSPDQNQRPSPLVRLALR